MTNSGPNSISWNLANTSPLFSISQTSGTLAHGASAQTATVSVTTAATNLLPGSYSTTLAFANLSDNFVQSRQLSLAIVTPPAITAQPMNLALLDGMTAVFSVATASNALMYYQWQKNGTNLKDGGAISGTATSTLTIFNVSLTNVANYSVVLSNAAGVLVSSNAALTIVPSPPVIVQQPSSQSVLPGAPVSFSVGSVGNTPYFYHWMFNGTNLANNSTVSGATSNTLTISNVSMANVGPYSVVVSNSLGSTTSIGAMLSIIPVTVPGLDMTSLYSFDGTTGATPYSPLIVGTDNNLYGTATAGGANGDGTIFKITTNGTLTRLLSFNYTDGAIPYGGLLLGKDGLLYGNAYFGGPYGDGAVFKGSEAGTLLLQAALNLDNGAAPVAGMVQGTDGNFYGTTLQGGAYNYGTIFRMTTVGQLSTLVSFNGTDGAYPSAVLIQATDGNFYGTCENGGDYGGGTVFKMTPSGVITNIYSFTGGSDGYIPIPGLVQALDGNFYGMTYQGGSNGFGTLFEITSSGEFITRYAFTGNDDGGNPWGGLMQAADGNLYGTTQSEGTYSFGTIFQFAPTGGFSTVAQFDGYTGGNPGAPPTQGKDGNLYGTAETGGFYNDGTIYRLNFSGPLQITGQPADQSVYSGGAVSFNVATFGAGPVFYQWQQNGINLTNGVNISGANSNTLTLSNASAANAAYYSVIVSNSINSLTSDDALLEVMVSPPKITSQPASQTVIAGTTATITVVAAGDQPLAFQWQKSGTNLSNGGAISGATSSSLIITGVTATNAGSYSVKVSNPLFTISSSNAVLTVLPVSAPGTSMTNLHQFAGTTSDGAFPYAGLIQGKDSNLYGTTESGGSLFSGVIFKSTLAGQVTTLYSFTNGPGAGANPESPLLQDTNGSFYGTATAGGNNFDGVAFHMAANGVGTTTIYSFSDDVDGAVPVAGLIQGSDGFLYGTALEGGSNSYGSVFKMKTNGTLTPLYGFTGGNDGGFPYGGLVQGPDGSLYGTAVEFGTNGYGTVFKLATNGAFTTLVAFAYTNGAFPQAGVVLGRDGNLYGTTAEGGAYGYGTVFLVTTSGQLTTLVDFNSTNGSIPLASLVQGTDGNLYGTTTSGGAGGWGTAFRITTNGVLTTLLWFDGLNGADPEGALVQASDGNFYGTTAQGGAGFNPSAGGGNGTLFQITVPIFTTNLITKSSAVACLPYLNSGIANFAAVPPGDALTFGKVSGPAWLIVSTNGILSGTPTNSDIGTNMFVVSLTDTNGFTATTKLQLAVVPDPPPTFVGNPISLPWASQDQPYSGSIATNATDPEINSGDVLAFGKVAGPEWLNVGPDGTLSGTPQDVNAGLNTFVVGVTNLGGASATAFLSIYVDSPPTFAPAGFSKPAAIAGIPYSGSIATNATDPDIPVGDRLTYYLVTGPSWLNVATNGVLSGAPASVNLGINNFLVLVTDSRELSAVGTMTINVIQGNPPAWLANPFSEPSAVAGAVYSANIATNAIDPNIGGVPNFVKISGPAWLNVAANGALSGVPVSTNVGINAFTLNVTDGTGFSSNSVMSINVTPAAPLVLTITPQGPGLMLNWSGGVAPYQVKMATGFNSAAWTNVGTLTPTTNMTVTPSNSSTFYRVQGQ